MSQSPSQWRDKNLLALRGFSLLLIAAGVLGFVTPERLALMSGATPYNVFHLLAAGVALLLVRQRDIAGSILFNLVFGVIDLYQALAGVLGWFPASWFALRPADHVVHVIVGGALVTLGLLGRRESIATAPGTKP